MSDALPMIQLGPHRVSQDPWSDGTGELLVSPHEFLEKLAALVPPPHLHLLRYHGALAPHAVDRQHFVPSSPPKTTRAPLIAPASSAAPCRTAPR